MFKKINKGFTLIEILIVIAIISIISSFSFFSLISARERARDAVRKSDMSQLRTALGLYLDTYDYFPVCGNWDKSSPDLGASIEEGSNCYNTVLEDALTSGDKPLLGELPRDPLNKENKPEVQGGDDKYLYRYASNGEEYVLIYQLEEDSEEKMIRGW